MQREQRGSRIVPALFLSAAFWITACVEAPIVPTEPEPTPAGSRADAAADRVRVIITLRDRGAQSAMVQAANARGARVFHQYRNFPMLALEVDRNALPGLLRSRGFVSVAEDRASMPSLDVSVPLIRADRLHDLGIDGRGYAVAVLDAGIDRDHPFVAGRVVEEYCYSSPSAGQVSLCRDSVGPGVAGLEFDECQDGANNICNHGMFTTGIAAGSAGLASPAPPAGVAPGADIIFIRVFTRIEGEEACGAGHVACVTTWESDQIAGLDKVYELRTSYQIAAVNMSLGGGEWSSTCDAIPVATPIAQLWSAGIATTVSSGNAGFPAAVGAPGCVSAAVTVGATDDADAIASFSNRGELLDLFAPGRSIYSSVEDDGYNAGSGTSASAPHVAGAWALMRQAFPSFTPAQILDRLQLTGVPITDENGVTRSRIDLLAALAPGSVVIRKATSPAGRSGFGFTDDIKAPNAFTLDDGGSRTFTGVLPGSYTVNETDPGEFTELTSIACTDPSGHTSVSVRDRNAYIGVAPGETVTCTFTNADLPPEVSATPASQVLQYSDYAADITITGRDSEQDALVASFQYRQGAGGFVAGLPAGLAAAAGGCPAEGGVQTCTWTIAGTAGVAAGSYTIRATVTDDDGSSAYRDVVVTVQPENASVRFADGNPIAVQVAAPGGTSGAFSLLLHVEETEPDLAAGTAAPGDLALAAVTIALLPVGPGGSAAGACVQTGLTGSGYDQVRTLRCDFASVPVNTYAVVVTIGGGYFLGSGEDVVTVFDPSLGFTTGGGWFYWPGTTDRTSFGYNMKYNRKGQNPQGSVLLIRHVAEGAFYRIRSNALTSLAMGESGGFDWASFTGKATYQEPGWAEPLGSYEFVAYAEDHGQPGSGDRFWIALRDRNGVTVAPVTMASPATGNAAPLEGGNVLVPHAPR